MMMAKCEEQMEGEGGRGKRFGDFQAEKDVDMSLVTTFARSWRCVFIAALTIVCGSSDVRFKRSLGVEILL